MTKEYYKLVRDRIPEIIKNSGKTCRFKLLDSEYYALELKAKLQEECDEYKELEDVEALADIIEVVYALAKNAGYTLEELEVIRKKKADNRGGFDDRIFLESVEE